MIAGNLKRVTVTVLYLGVVFVVSSCGKKEETETKKQRPMTPELMQALDILSKIDPQRDTLDDIILSYKSATKALSQKVLRKQGQVTPEEKYVYFLSDSFLLFHQLVKFINDLIREIMKGKLNMETVSNIIAALPKSPSVQSPTKLLTYQHHQEDVFKLPYGCGDIDGLAQTLCSAINGIFLDRLEDNIRLLREIQTEVESKQEDLAIEIKTLPIKIELVVLRYSIDFGGKHDLGTIYFFESGLNLTDSIFRMIFSINIDLLQGAIDSVPEYLRNVSLTEDILLHGGRILSFLLDKNPGAFTIASTTEVERARAQLTESIVKSQKFLQYVKEKNTDSQNAVLFFSSEDNSYKIRYLFGNERREPAILKDDDAKVFLSSVESVRKNIEGEKNYISTRELVYVASTILVATIKSGLLDPIVDAAISLLGREQSKTIRNLLDSQLFTPGTVAGIVSSVLGDVFYFDLGTMYKNLSGRDNNYTPTTTYREWLPAWTTYLPEFKNNFVIEWDCGAKLYDESITNYKTGRASLYGLACTRPAGQDIEHFAEALTTSIEKEEVPNWGNIKTIPPDGIKGEFMYILFQDPSFGGLLLIKGSGIKADRNSLSACGVDLSPTPRSYRNSRRAGNCALNAAIQSIIGDLIASLSR